MNRFVPAVLVGLLLSLHPALADVIVSYTFGTSASPTTGPAFEAPDVDASDFLAAGAGMGAITVNFGDMSQWPWYAGFPWDDSTEAPSSFYQFSVSGFNDVGPDYTVMSITNLSFQHSGSASGPTGFTVRVSSNGGAFSQVDAGLISTGGTAFNETQALSVSGSTGTVIRIYANGAPAGGIWRIDNVLLEGTVQTLTIPEPAALSMLLLGGCAFWLARWRRRPRGA